MLIEVHFKHFTSFITDRILQFQIYYFQLFPSNVNL